MYRLSVFLLLFIPTLAFTQGDDDMSTYVVIKPAFITNYNRGARLKYLKTNVALRVNADNERDIRHHLPYIKNQLVLLFSNQAEENLTSTVGKESLRREALNEVKRAIGTVELSGAQWVMDLYFTDFIVQQ